MPVAPGAVDLRPLLPPVWDQGERGTCLAFAVTASHELRRAAGARVLEDLAEELLYWGCKQIDGDPRPGTSFESAAAALQRWGQPAGALWPYDPRRDDTSPAYQPPPQALDPAVCYRAVLEQIPATMAEIKRWLALGRAVALGVVLSEGFFDPPAGRIPLPAPAEIIPEGHAVLIAGYDDGPNPGDGVLIVRNSWGSDWGDAGYGYLPYAYVERYGAVVWVVA